MTDERPGDWDWVKAQQDCETLAVFRLLRKLAEQNVETRNKEWDAPRFKVADVDGAAFAVFNTTNPNVKDRIYFGMSDDLSQIVVNRGGKYLTPYTTGLTDLGVCVLRFEKKEMAPWQALQRELESLLFG